MKRLTMRFEDGTKPPKLTNRSSLKTATNYGVSTLFKDLSASLLCLSLAGLTLSSCASIPEQNSVEANGLKASLFSFEASSADLVVAKTSHTRFAVLPATLDVGSPLLSALDLRRGQDFVNKPLDESQVGLEAFSQVERRSHKRDTRLSKLGNYLFAAIGTPRVVRAGRFLQCVPFAREASGIEIFGNANRWWSLADGKYRKAKSPEAGSVFVMNGYRTTRRGHVAVVRKVVDSRTMIIDHSNWLNDGKIYLSAPVRDVSDDNDWSRVQVWYTPGQQWGSRTYTAKGFLRPNTSQVASLR